MLKFNALIVGQDPNLIRALPELLSKAGFNVDVIQPSSFFRNTRIRRVVYTKDPADIPELVYQQYTDNYDLVIIADDQTQKDILNSAIPDNIKLKILPVTSKCQYDHLYSKIGLAKALQNKKVFSPDFRIAENIEQLATLSNEIGFPLFLKIDSSGGGAGVFLCHSMEDLKNTTSKLTCFPILIQKKIDGQTIDLSAFYKNGNLIHFTYSIFENTIGGQFGPSSLRTYVQLSEIEPKVINELIELGCQLGIDGFANITCIHSNIDNRRFYIEADLRPNAWIDYGKYIGEDISLSIHNFFVTGKLFTAPKTQNLNFPKTLLVPHLYKLSQLNILCNKYNAWRYIPALDQREFLHYLISQPLSNLESLIIRLIKPYPLVNPWKMLVSPQKLLRRAYHFYILYGFLRTVRKIINFIGLCKWPGKLMRIVTSTYSENSDWFGYTAHDPLISVIAVNYNGAEYLPFFLESLSKQNYRNFELIIVDNGSKDDSEEIVNKHKAYFPGEVIFIKTGKNLGFAEGNNVALDYAKGEFLALLNIDAKAHEDWLREMIETIRGDGFAAVVASKILFWSRFHDLEIHSEQKIILNLKALEQSLSYKKFFVRAGVVIEGNLVSDDSKKIVISIPIQEEPIEIRISPLSLSAKNVEIRTPTKVICHFSLTEEVKLDIDFSINSVINAGFIVNNAGSIADYNDLPCDRGFAEYDKGQYDQVCYLPFFCGCSVLIRRVAILDRKIFVSEFFAYYEDSELSRWITSSGWKIIYSPRSIVYHRHSATLSEGSASHSYLVQRSKLIFTHTGLVDELASKLTVVREAYKDLVKSELMNILNDYDQLLIQRLKIGDSFIEHRKAIGIYNSYWNTKGGGESHALSIASELQKFSSVELISESDFDIDALSKYFAIDLSRCRKIVLPKFDIRLTSRFFVFINSTYNSNLTSLAPHSWFLVSFPHQQASKAMLASYFFLFNSPYTESWARKIWGNNIVGKLIYPVRMLRASTDIKTISFVHEKKKIILSVGRFNPVGHSKNQLEIAKAYRSLVKEMSGENQWKLVLVGGLDYSQAEQVAYFDLVKSCLTGLNVELLPNIERDSLNLLFSEATLYVHATGMGYNKTTEPESFEHFGITPVEAVQSGCIPVVFDTGGPADFVRNIGIGYCFSSAISLQATLKKLIQSDFSTLINECKIAQERGTNFVDVESNRPLPIEPLIKYFKNSATLP
jgi:GT2 family glycosyltransferase